MSQRGAPSASGSSRYPSSAPSKARGTSSSSARNGDSNNITNIGHIGKISNPNTTTNGSNNSRRPPAPASVCGTEMSCSSDGSRAARSVISFLTSLSSSSRNHDVDRLPAPSITSNPGPGSVCGSVRSVSTSSSRHHEVDRFSVPSMASLGDSGSVRGSVRSASHSPLRHRDVERLASPSVYSQRGGGSGGGPGSECGSSRSSLLSSSDSSSDSSDSILSLNALSLLPQSQAQTTQPQWNIRASVLSAGFDRRSRGTPSSVYALIKCTPEVANQSPRLTTTSNDLNDDNKSRYNSPSTTLVGKTSNEQALVPRSSSSSLSSTSKALTLRAPAPLPVSACLCDRAGVGSSNNNGGDRAGNLDPLQEEMKRNLADAHYEYEECIYLPRSAIVYNAKPKDPPENPHLQRVWYHAKDLREYMCSLERYMDEVEECLKIHVSERMRKKEVQVDEERKLRHELDIFRTRLLFTGQAGLPSSSGNSGGSISGGELVRRKQL
ncbi:hypothetical protein B0O80DRAFT_495464 [Mortierella sp. GBAus27b]|nr:hypothetical protein B0O80DRAFT_495464 [Mortierella sp. GBAus27b]